MISSMMAWWNSSTRAMFLAASDFAARSKQRPRCSLAANAVFTSLIFFGAA